MLWLPPEYLILPAVPATLSKELEGDSLRGKAIPAPMHCPCPYHAWLPLCTHRVTPPLATRTWKKGRSHPRVLPTLVQQPWNCCWEHLPVPARSAALVASVGSPCRDWAEEMMRDMWWGSAQCTWGARGGRLQPPILLVWGSPPRRNAPAWLQLQGGEVLAERRGMKAWWGTLRWTMNTCPGRLEAPKACTGGAGAHASSSLGGGAPPGEEALSSSPSHSCWWTASSPPAATCSPITLCT